MYILGRMSRPITLVLVRFLDPPRTNERNCTSVCQALGDIER